MKNKSDYDLVTEAVEIVCDDICKYRKVGLPQEAMNGICSECKVADYYDEICRRMKERQVDQTRLTLLDQLLKGAT